MKNQNLHVIENALLNIKDNQNFLTQNNKCL